MALALDEPNDDDASFDVSGFTFAIEKTLLEQVKSVTVDLNYMGFSLEPEVALAPAGGSSSCGSSCGSCGSH